ncbi:toll/interleukin-1 receptor domain-containing protein [Pollutimonas sp. H1-120]|uniref:toll/interleukin-1 receptor domain-containing protein n=1 Tax=Pollutimonas sp. H1-120 TaxID=3148824 RepID=UPI003B526633
MKIFLSHQKHDSETAKSVQSHLKAKHGIDCYLDVIDPGIKFGEDIASHVRAELARCTQLLAIVSEATKLSWWVPWEIGVATEKDYPLATFGRGVTIPEYLKKWPYLQTMADLDKYAKVSSTTSQRSLTASMESRSSGSVPYKFNATEHFYKTLRAELGQ